MLVLTVLVALVATCLPGAVEGETKVLHTALPYHQMMSPKWLEKNAELISPHTVYPKYLEILSVTDDYERALRVQLVAPNILKSTDSVTVKATVALDTALAISVDHDPILGISDGTSFIGFIAYDIKNYPTLSPCSSYEADIDGKILKNYVDNGGPTITTAYYSTQRKMQFRLAEQLGVCQTEHNAGYINIANYLRTLDPSKGLYFEMFHHHGVEKYRINYIEVDVDLDE